MQVEIEIGLTSQRWTFGRTGELDSWIERLPWHSGERSQAVSLKVGCYSDVASCAREVRRQIYANDAGVFLPQVFMPLEAPVRGIVEQLTAAIYGAPNIISRSALKGLLVDRLYQAPQIFCLAFGENADSNLIEELRDLIEELNRTGCFYPLIAIVFTLSRTVGNSFRHYDISLAMPSEGVFSQRTFDPYELWARYLHLKAAWESAGRVSHAVIYGRAWKSVQPFKEDALEISCSDVAAQLWSEVPDDSRAAFERYLEEVATPLTGFGYEGRLADLVQSGLLWQPVGHCAPFLAPWAARASAAKHEKNNILRRGSLVVSPLNLELLNWCFQLEALERSRYTGDTTLALSDESNDAYAKFLARPTSPPATMYPSSYPFSLGSHDFESLGGFCSRLAKGRRTRARRLLLDVRNSLCHGHYAGWKTIELMLAIRSELI